MVTITACMIVKNEEATLARCLNSIKNIVDEIIIVDTGSTDQTKEIASRYTDKIYDFTWIYDFAAARNYSFSKATKEYIYVADADEVIDEQNQEKFLRLKEVLTEEIDIVQMYYTNQLEYGTTYNYDKELRPKLYRRVRNFVWRDPIHESVKLDPVIYDSEIEIIHKPLQSHAARDFDNFYRAIERGTILSEKLTHMFAKELYIAGSDEDFIKAAPYFEQFLISKNCSQTEILYIQCVLVKYARIVKDVEKLMKNALKNIAAEASAEVCYELGEYYYDKKDYQEALIWYYNAAYETKCQLNIHYAGDYPLKRLAQCYKAMNNEEQYEAYSKLYNEWK